MSLVIEQYSEKALVVRGSDTKSYTNELTNIGGKWNPGLKGGGGWIFPNIKRDVIEKLITNIESGTVVKNIVSSNTTLSGDTFTISKREWLAVLERIEKLELNRSNTIGNSASLKKKQCDSDIEIDEDTEEKPKRPERLMAKKIMDQVKIKFTPADKAER